MTDFLRITQNTTLQHLLKNKLYKLDFLWKIIATPDKPMKSKRWSTFSVEWPAISQLYIIYWVSSLNHLNSTSKLGLWSKSCIPKPRQEKLLIHIIRDLAEVVLSLVKNGLMVKGIDLWQTIIMMVDDMMRRTIGPVLKNGMVSLGILHHQICHLDVWD